MTPRFEGKIALISGAARGQGRNQAVRLAAEGADIIAFDVAGPVPGQGTPVASPEDLAETVRLVEQLDRRIIASVADVRDAGAVADVVEHGVSELGGLDVVVANAGVTGIPGPAARATSDNWATVIDTNLTGAFNTIRPAISHLIERGAGSVVIMSSSIGLKAVPNMVAYASTKAGLTGLMRALALELAPHSIRVNTVNPTTVATPMVLNPVSYKMFRPDLDDPSEADAIPAFRSLNALPTPWVEADDVTNAVLYLASDDGRYVTGVTLPVDAGYSVK
ncbi:mycofactocin-coupled SDR family oxidoreductase (plasmid) [Rhodococcus qingshengii]|uniref:mycofactocin-coupled SDR family oxidoreductase n=1 Tax=Rhodococcus TaxID=1827 RepID=UPI000F61F8A3|nr:MULTISPECIES: mycofactocin-coupled SDR family oxidoreductase [Rhodococcus]AZI65866.1 NAD(P)-dependent oxidoreductase [Rhodococcus sp. NJ-530]BDQ23817.1 mycofactocin-coupled SDR family oxidoreductase [Rhodococcus qingshengii]